MSDPLHKCLDKIPEGNAIERTLSSLSKINNLTIEIAKEIRTELGYLKGWTSKNSSSHAKHRGCGKPRCLIRNSRPDLVTARFSPRGIKSNRTGRNEDLGGHKTGVI